MGNQVEYARKIIELGCSDELKQKLLSEYPEMLMSRDEQIRQNLIDMVEKVREDSILLRFKDIPFDDYIAWLEDKKVEEPKKKDPRAYTIEDAGFSTRTYNTLLTICDKGTTIKELYDLLNQSDIRRLDRCGRKTFNEIWYVLEDSFGCHFNGSKFGHWNWSDEERKYKFIEV